MRDENRSDILLPVLAGLAGGLLLGVLFAPRSGRKTRRIIREKVEGLQVEASTIAQVGKAAMHAARNTMVDHRQGQRDDLDDVARFLMDEGMYILDSLAADEEVTPETAQP